MHRKQLGPPRSRSSHSAPLVPTRPPGRLLHLNQPAVPRNKVDGELVLPPHHARRLHSAAAAAVAATTTFTAQDRRAPPLRRPQPTSPRSGPAPAHRFRLPPPRLCPLIGHALPTPQKGGGHTLRALSAHAPTLKGIHKTKALALSCKYEIGVEGFIFCALLHSFVFFFFFLTREGLNWMTWSFKFTELPNL